MPKQDSRSNMYLLINYWLHLQLMQGCWCNCWLSSQDGIGSSRSNVNWNDFLHPSWKLKVQNILVLVCWIRGEECKEVGGNNLSTIHTYPTSQPPVATHYKLKPVYSYQYKSGFLRSNVPTFLPPLFQDFWRFQQRYPKGTIKLMVVLRLMIFSCVLVALKSRHQTVPDDFFLQ